MNGMEFRFDPVLAPIFVLLFAVVSIAIAWRAGIIKPLALRIVSVCLLSIVLLSPVVMTPIPDERGAPVLVMLVDGSRSMATRDQPVGDTPIGRLDAVRRTYLDANYLRMLSSVAAVRVRTFDEHVRELSSEQSQVFEPDGDRTDLHAALQETIDGLPAGSTVCVLSDGRETEVPRASSTRELVGLAKAAGVRIHAVSLGSEGRPADVSLRATLDRQLVFESMPVSIRVAVDQVGYEGRRATVRVLSRNPEARVLAEKMVTLGDHAGATLEFVPEPRSPGEAPIVVREYRVRVEPLPGESDVENNERRVFVQITGQRIRVMVIENEPSWDTRFVIRALERDPQVELTSVLGLDRKSVV